MTKLKSILSYLGIVALLGIGSYTIGSQFADKPAEAVWVSKIMGGGVTPEGFNVQLCPGGDEQLVIEYEDETLNVSLDHSACVGSECLISYNATSSLTSVCGGSPGSLTENCDPNTTTGQNVNAQRFEGDARTFADMSTSNSTFGNQCSNWIGPGATNPVVASCVVAGTVAATADYGDGVFYAADLMNGTFGPKNISFCGMAVGKTTDSDNCLHTTGANNHTYSAIAIDSTTDSAFVNHGGFLQEITHWNLDSSTGLVDSIANATGAGALDYRENSNAQALKMMAVIPGGNLFILRKDSSTARVIVWPQDLSAEADDYLIDLAAGNSTTILYSANESAFYACGVGSGSVTTVIKFSADGTELATATSTEVGSCYDMVMNEDTGRLYISVNGFTTAPNIVEIDVDTLAFIRTLELDPSNSGTVGMILSIDAAAEKIYATSNLSGSLSHVFRVSTCSSI